MSEEKKIGRNPFWLRCERCGRWLLFIPSGLEGINWELYEEMKKAAEMSHKCPKAPPTEVR
jgi:hypothetical protein